NDQVSRSQCRTAIARCSWRRVRPRHVYRLDGRRVVEAVVPAGDRAPALIMCRHRSDVPAGGRVRRPAAFDGSGFEVGLTDPRVDWRLVHPEPLFAEPDRTVEGVLDGPAGLVPGHRGPSASLVPTGAQFRLRVLKPLARVSLAGLEAVAVGGAVVLVRLSLPAIAPGTEVVAEPGVFRGRVDQFADALPGESARDRPADDSADQRADRSAGG